MQCVEPLDLRMGICEVYVAPFPGQGPCISISINGGCEAAWAQNMHVLFDRQANRIMAVAFRGGSTDSPKKPVELFSGRCESSDNTDAVTPDYDVMSDDRFIMFRRRNPLTPTIIHLVLNWPEALRTAHAAPRAQPR